MMDNLEEVGEKQESNKKLSKAVKDLSISLIDISLIDILETGTLELATQDNAQVDLNSDNENQIGKRCGLSTKTQLQHTGTANKQHTLQ